MKAFSPALVEDFLAHHWRFHPVDATFMGEIAHDRLLPPLGPAALRDERASLAALSAGVAATAEPEDLGLRLDRRLMGAELAFQSAQAHGRHRTANPAWISGEAAFSIISLLLPQSAPTRLDAVLARLVALPDFLADGAANLAGMSVPRSWVARAQREAGAMAEFLSGDIRL